ncbi:hypothetical protein V1509DRAFT_633250, partial [Lipomyces kononenkoae]
MRRLTTTASRSMSMMMDDILNVNGRQLDIVCLNPNVERHVPDELLTWHFRQAVLANMRGVGEPIFESDFPPGADMRAAACSEDGGRTFHAA